MNSDIIVCHRHNYMKYQVLKLLYNADADVQTTYRYIAKCTGTSIKSASHQLKQYYKYKYIGRRKVKSKENGYPIYVYNLRKLGVETLIKLENRFRMGYEMNLRKPNPQLVDSYMTVRQRVTKKKEDEKDA